MFWGPRQPTKMRRPGHHVTSPSTLESVFLGGSSDTRQHRLLPPEEGRTRDVREALELHPEPPTSQGRGQIRSRRY